MVNKVIYGIIKARKDILLFRFLDNLEINNKIQRIPIRPTRSLDIGGLKAPKRILKPATQRSKPIKEGVFLHVLKTRTRIVSKPVIQSQAVKGNTLLPKKIYKYAAGILALALVTMSSWFMYQQIYGPNYTVAYSKNGEIRELSGRLEESNGKIDYKAYESDAEIAFKGLEQNPDNLAINITSSTDERIRTEVVYVNPNAKFEDAQISLNKTKPGKINALVMCSDQNYNVADLTCSNWEIAEPKPQIYTDKINFNTKHFSAYAGAYLEIVNIEANLTQGDLWQSEFKTYGTSTLVVNAIEGTDFTEDLSFIGIFCGNTQLPSDVIIWNENSFSITNYSCDGQTSMVRNTAISPGRHWLSYNFGSTSDARAHNFACDTGTLAGTCTVTSTQAMSNNDTISGVGDLVIATGGNLTTSVTEAFNIHMDGNVDIQAGGAVNGNINNLYANNLTVAGQINANGLGHAGGTAGSTPTVGSGSGGGQIRTVAYRQITVTNSTGSALTNYAVKITLDTATSIAASRMRSDCGDIRFYDSDITTSLSYWLSSSEGACNTASTVFWVEVPSISASASKFIYAIYSRAEYTSESSGANTFQSFDDFDSLAQWTGDTSYFPVSSSIMTPFCCGNTGATRRVNSTFTWRYGIVEARMRRPVTSTSYELIWNPQFGASWFYYFGIPFGETNLRLRNSNSVSNVLSVAANTNYYIFGMGFETGGTTQYQYINGSLARAEAHTPVASASSVAFAFPDSSGSQANIDWIRIRPFVSTEPSVSAGTEQTGYIGGAGGGGYGGAGGVGSLAGTTLTSAGATYGSNTNPTDYGSGGGGAAVASGGNGGGLVRINVSSTVTVSGSITADGTTPSNANYGAGGGSGGSIVIKAQTITSSGSPTIAARGGNGSTGSTAGTRHGGGGGGGRVALIRNTYSYAGTLSVAGGTSGGSPATSGSTGTTYSEDSATTAITAICSIGSNNCTVSGTATNPQQGYNVDSIAGTASAQSGDTVSTVQISIENTSTDQWYDSSNNTFSSMSELFNSASGTTSWSYSTSSIVWDISTIYKIRIQVIDSDGVTSNQSVIKFAFVNSPPVISNVTADQDSNGFVNISYDVTDLESSSTTVYLAYDSEATLIDSLNDTETGGVEVSDADNFPNAGTIIIDDEMISYTSKSGNDLMGTITRGANSSLADSHNSATPIYIIASTISGDEGPSITNGTSKSMIWTAKSDADGFYSATGQIAVIANDLAVASNIGQTLSSVFELDLKDPVPGTPTGGGSGFNVNQNDLSIESNDKTSSPNSILTINVSDDTDLDMILSESSTFVGASYESYNTTKSFTLSAGDGLKTVYGRFNDEKNNSTSVLSDAITLDTTAPATPATTFIQNVSNAETFEYRIFFTWIKNIETDWYKYEVHRSLDGSSYTLFETITDNNINYIIDTGLSVDQNYFYKVKSVDDIDNETPFTIAESMTPNGNPTDGTGPEISDVQSSNLANTSAKITWTTDEVSTSRVEYSIDTSYGSSKIVDGYVIDHSVTVLGLDSGTTYNYRVRSCDGGSNCTTSSSGTFATTSADSADPNISNITASNITATSATISWETNEETSSFVEYSSNLGFGNGIMFGRFDFTDSHEVILPATLDPDTEYYFKVRSTDSIGNESVSSEDSFTTLTAASDTTGPVITLVTVQDIEHNTATVTWSTDEPATSFVDFGQTLSFGQTIGGYELNTSHSVQLPTNLTADTDYNFRVRSFDSLGNESVGSNQTFDTDGDPGDSTDPNITSVTIGEPTSTAVTITWTTDEPADSYIEYSEDYSYVLRYGSNEMSTSHSVTLVGLTPATEYYFRASSIDPSGNQALDDNNGDTYSFATSASGSAPARISAVNIFDVESNTATISWATNENTDSYIEYGFSKEYEWVIGSRANTRAHTVVLPEDLIGDTTYHFRIRSTDSSDNISVTQDYTFTTEASEAVDGAEDITGPVISAVDEILTSTSAVVIQWNTDEDATSQVEYGTSLSYGTTTSNDTTLTKQHAVGISGLTPNTIYYYRITSSDAASNQTISDNSGSGHTFTTSAEAVQQSSGGGSSRDTSAPSISQILVINISASSATVTWTTDEVSNGIVNYGTSTDYNEQEGTSTSYTLSHTVKLTGLISGTDYFFQIESQDIFANTARSTSSFKTLGEGETPSEPTDPELPNLTEEEQSQVGQITELIKTGTASFINEAFKAFVDAIKDNPSSEQIVEEDFLNSINEVAPLVVSKPIITGETITAITGPTSARIVWFTDKSTNGIIALAMDSNYNAGAEEPYAIKVGNPEESVRRHEVLIENLQPNTLYHYEARSKASLGETAKSGDLTFRTSELTSDIEDFQFLAVEETQIQIKWSTTLPTRSQIQVRNAATGQLQTGTIPSYLREHEFTFTDLIPATSYNLTISSIDESGNSKTSSIIPFSTIITSNPPEISQVRINTALIPGRVEKVQAIITWKTSKPATSRLFYEEGVSSNQELTFSTTKDENLTQEHILVTTVFMPGKVYRFRVESSDALDNTSQSKDFTLLTPKPRETVVDLIISNFEDTFSFLKRLGL